MSKKVLEKFEDQAMSGLQWVNTVILNGTPHKCSARRALRGAVGLFVSAPWSCVYLWLSFVSHYYYYYTQTHTHTHTHEAPGLILYWSHIVLEALYTNTSVCVCIYISTRILILHLRVVCVCVCVCVCVHVYICTHTHTNTHIALVVVYIHNHTYINVYAHVS